MLTTNLKEVSKEGQDRNSEVPQPKEARTCPLASWPGRKGRNSASSSSVPSSLSSSSETSLLLVLPSDAHRASTRLQMEGYRWWELEVIQTEHELARQLEVGCRDCNLLLAVMVRGHDFYYITLIFGPLDEAERGQGSKCPMSYSFFILKVKEQIWLDCSQST